MILYPKLRKVTLKCKNPPAVREKLIIFVQMGLLIYTLKAAVLLALLYAGWRVLLARETFHRLGRCVLAGGAVLCCVLPACVVTLHRTVAVEPREAAFQALEGGARQTLEQVSAAAPWWPAVLAGIYLAGVAAVLLRWLVGAAGALRIVLAGERVGSADGRRIVVSDHAGAPFSWMHRIVIPRADWERGCPEILAHEQAHVRAGHAEEDLLLTVITAFQWFNPAAWALRRDLRTLHEYEADTAVLASGMDRKAYQLSLIGRAAAARGFAVGSPYGGQPLGARIAMMRRRRSPALRALRALYVLPLAALSLLATARTQTDFLYAAAPADARIAAPAEARAVPYAQTDIKPGTRIVEYYGQTLERIAKDYVLSSFSLHDLDDVRGLVPVRIVLTASGCLDSAQILTDRLTPAQEAAVMTLLTRSPFWRAGVQEGRAVPVEFILPLDFGWK